MSNTTEWIAAAIRHALLDAGRTKRAVADETGIPYPTLNRKISGKRDFTLSELLSIAEPTRQEAISYAVFCSQKNIFLHNFHCYPQ